MVSHDPDKFGGQKHCGSRDSSSIDFSSISSRFNPPLLSISKGHGLKAHGISYYELQSCSHAFKAAIGQKFENSFCQSVQKL